MFLSLCWIAGGHTIHPTIEGLLPITAPEPTVLQVRTPKELDYRCMPLHPAERKEVLYRTEQELSLKRSSKLHHAFLIIDDKIYRYK